MIKRIKNLDIGNMTVALIAVKKTLKNREGFYSLKFVEVDKEIKKFLVKNTKEQLQNCNSISQFTFDNLEADLGEMFSINAEETEFSKIIEELNNINPEENKVKAVEELFKTNLYLVTFRDHVSQEIKLIGLKKIPESWDLRRKNEMLRKIFFKEQKFHDLSTEHVFSLSKKFDAFYFEKELLVVSKRNFEISLNFREGMKRKAENLYEDLSSTNFIKNIDFLREKCGDNLKYLKKLATISNLGLYKEKNFQDKVVEVGLKDEWDVEFEEGKIVINDTNFESVLYILENKRLFSKLTMETKDVEGRAQTKTFTDQS